MIRLLIFILFLGSGMTALIYQVLWTKLLTLTFGVTTLAVSAVLTSFFGGLALGSYIGGHWIDRHRDGLKWYGMAEIIIGLYALLFLSLLTVNNTVYVFIAQHMAMDFYGLSLLKFVLSLFLLIIPSTLMGTTLPILSKTLANSRVRFARDIGDLYAINTIGAVAGAVLTAFFLIPAIGMSTIIYAVGIVNIVLGGIAVYINGFFQKSAPPSEESEEYGEPLPSGATTTSEKDTIPSYFTTLLIVGFAVSGFTGLAYEVIWTRILGFILTGTIYAFTTVLATFLCGIAAGSLVFAQFIDRIKHYGRLIWILAVVEVLIGLSSIALIILYNWMPDMEIFQKVRSTQAWSEFIYLNYLTSFLLLFIPTFLFGATFPVVCKLYSQRIEKVGAKIGNIYSVNTVGGILGSFAGGFILIPFIGMQNSIVLIGCINILIGALFIVANPFAARKNQYITLGAGAFCTLLIIILLPDNMPRALHESFLTKDEHILFYDEGTTSTVMIAERSGRDITSSNKRLCVNGNMATAAFYEGLQINRFQGVLPMVLHPDPQDVLVICFGSGTTFGTLSQFDVNQVDNVDISKTVIKGASFFKKENRDVLHNPKSNIIIDDGRSYLEVTTKKYDVITEEPMHPSLAGVVNLYTKEYYELVKSHLKEGGIMSQWIPLYNLSVEDVRMLTKTFQSVFPHTTIWLANADIFLIGSPTETMIDYERIESRIFPSHIKNLLQEIDLEDPLEFLNTFLMNEEMVRAYAGSAPVIDDNMPLVEFTGPKSLNLNTISPNLAELIKYREKIAPYLQVAAPFNKEEITARLEPKFMASRYNLIGRAYFAAGNFRTASDYFKIALQIDPGDRNSLHYKRKLLLYWS